MLKVVGQDRSSPVIWTLKVSPSPDVVFTGQDAARTGVTETKSIISTSADKAKSAKAEGRRAPLRKCIVCSFGLRYLRRVKS